MGILPELRVAADSQKIKLHHFMEPNKLPPRASRAAEEQWLRTGTGLRWGIVPGKSRCRHLVQKNSLPAQNSPKCKVAD